MIGITLGDPAGIGPEVVLKAVAKIRNAQSKIRIIGSLAMLSDLKERLALKLNLKQLVFDVIPKFNYQLGKTDEKCGKFALSGLEVGVELLKMGFLKGIVTAPICKESLIKAGFKYPGHTEFLAKVFLVKRYAMLAYSPQLKIIFVTTHKPISQVAKSITKTAVLEKILLLNDFLSNYQKLINPKIAVLGLNPHTFEFSYGEEERIFQAIKEARKRGITATGPFPSDTINELIEKFDGFVAMYHDQGMIPMKLLARDKGVNVTLGLPYPRTSPLHGCAFDIAGKGIANPSSMISAIKLCLFLIGERRSSCW